MYVSKLETFLFAFALVDTIYSRGKESACRAEDARDAGSIPGSGRSPGAGNGHLLQYSCLEKPKGREASWATVYGGCKESDTAELASSTKICPQPSYQLSTIRQVGSKGFCLCRQNPKET